MSSTESKNLEAISKAIDQHNANCPFPAAEVRMNPFEIERLGWDEIRGLPLVGDPEIGTGRFRIVCSRELGDEGLEARLTGNQGSGVLSSCVAADGLAVVPAEPRELPEGSPVQVLLLREDLAWVS